MKEIEKEIQYYTNPFPDFKIRFIIFWYFGICIAIFLQLILIDWRTPITFFIDNRQDYEFIDPIYEIFFFFIPTFLLIVILVVKFIEQFRSEFKLGIFLVVLTLPYLIPILKTS